MTPKNDPVGRKIGYARVSSVEQNLDVQLRQLEEAGCVKVYREKASGKSRQHRTELRRMLRSLEPGDVVVVTKIDRLARSVQDLFSILTEIDQKGCGFLCLAQPELNLGSATGRLLLAVLGGVAEWERVMIQTRCQEGRQRARELGVKFGRPNALTEFQKQDAIKRLQAGEPVRVIARTYNVSHTTIIRLRNSIEAPAERDGSRGLTSATTAEAAH